MSEIARQEQQREHGEAQKLAAKELMGGCIEAAVETADFSTTESGNWHDWLREEVVKALRERDAEIKRLREENSTFSDSLAAKADRIDRLGETVARQVAEIERLRELLREAEKMWPNPGLSTESSRWYRRVREALGD